MGVELGNPATHAPQAVDPQPDVSVVIASWNAKRHLIDCLRALEAEADAGSVAIETIVVDNGSSDGSADAVQHDFPWATLVRNDENLGFARASNVGLARATGRYVCLMNSDVRVRAGALGTLVRFMDARPTVGLVGPRILNPDGSLQASCRKFPALCTGLSESLAAYRLRPRSARWSGETMAYWSHDAERSVDAVSGCLCLARRAAVAEVGPLDERFFFSSEDVDWCMRFHAAGWDVRFCPEAEAIHVGAASSSHAARHFAVEKQRARLLFYRKHYSRSAVAGFTALIAVRHMLRIVARLVSYALWPSRRPALRARIDEHLACLRSLLYR